MSLVAEYYQTLGGLFREVYGSVFPEAVRSKVCGEALGTQVQSEIFLLLAGDRAADEVRETSEKAIEQFSDERDRQRQYQFRSEIEAIDGNWDLAREFLAKGIGCDSTDHQSIGRFIASVPESARPFPLLHWTRIGGMAAVASDQVEFESFADAWRTTGLDAFVKKLALTYPAHGILRRMACVYSALGDDAKLIETLRSLRSVVKANPTTLFGLIEVAAVLQSSGLAGRRNRDQMMRILGGSKNDPAATELLKKIARDSGASQPKIAAVASKWEQLLACTPTPQQLVDAAKIVAY
ncbi:hypothetical protein [Anatilimnocola aggregata]|nr:hypothetical protein [Anatilimnocola aggregata]